MNPGQCSFYELAEKVGEWGPTLVECSAIANVFGLATSYLVVFGSTMPYVVGSGPNTGTWTDTLLWASIGLLIVTPMAFAPTLDALRFTSALGMAAVLYLVRFAVAAVLCVVIAEYHHKYHAMSTVGGKD